MVNTCFLCLQNTNNRVCPQCNTYAHHGCWKKYIDNLAPVEFEVAVASTEHEIFWNQSVFQPTTVKCPVCRDGIEVERHLTRSHTAKARETTTVSIVKTFLRRVEGTRGKQNKIEVVDNLFDYLYKCKNFLKDHSKFRETVRDKLINLHNNDNWEDARFHYRRIFGGTIPC
jgi:hypothetical protein